jgi:hypothetical protein
VEGILRFTLEYRVQTRGICQAKNSEAGDVFQEQEQLQKEKTPLRIGLWRADDCEGLWKHALEARMSV